MSKAILIIVLLLLAGLTESCAAVETARFTVGDVARGQGKALDVRAGNHWYNRLWASPHRLVVYRKEDGTLEVVPEQSNPDVLTEMAGPLGTLADHIVYVPF